MKTLIIYERTIKERTGFKKHPFKEVKQYIVSYGGKTYRNGHFEEVVNQRLKVPFIRKMKTRVKKIVQKYYSELGRSEADKWLKSLLEKFIEEAEQQDWDKVFADFIGFTDFKLDKDGDGYCLVDIQGANLGWIEQEHFENAAQVIERMDAYVNDYVLDDEEWGSYESAEDALKKCPNHPLKRFLELIAYHINDVDLDNVYKKYFN